MHLHGVSVPQRGGLQDSSSAVRLQTPYVGPRQCRSTAVPIRAWQVAPPQQPPTVGSSRSPEALLATHVEQPWQSLPLRHVIESQQFDVPALDVIFAEALEMEGVRPGTAAARQLDGVVMSTLFYEPSTRTRLSFESAMARLGGTVLSTESAGEYSSAAKGETLEGAALQAASKCRAAVLPNLARAAGLLTLDYETADTVRTVEGYADCIVLRHFQSGSAKRAAAAASVPIINAGDGAGQHPTQALLDVYTIKREIGRLENFSIALVGDLANGRTVRSLAYLLSMYPGVKMYFVAPEVVRMKDDIKQYLDRKGVEWEEVDDLKAVAADVNVLYQTRIQKERFLDRLEDYAAARGKYIIDGELMKILPQTSVIMHPLPRVDEITTDVDADPRAAYFRQAKNGLYIRMALLKLALEYKMHP